MKWLSLIVLSVCLSLEAEEKEWSVPSLDRPLSFPKDHGSHPDFKIEWWYLTGHLFAEERRFGFQATFFRLGQEPVDIEAGENFGDTQIYMAHMALTDVEGDAFYHEERLNRAGWDAGAEVGRLDVRNGNWSLVKRDGSLHLVSSIQSEVAMELKLTPQKDFVIFGEEGISRKGPEGTAASYYITWTRLGVEGALEIDGETLALTGEAWMDHEISSSQLDRSQVGWDWAAIQFRDGRELMGFILRTESGIPSPYSRVEWIAKDGTLSAQNYGDFTWTAGGEWESPKTGAVYPISPLIETTDPATGKARALRLVPKRDDQEIVGGPGGVSYWEGTCDVVDEETGEIVGRAYLEMTGYTESIAEKMR